jgi:hypothetical protein
MPSTECINEQLVIPKMEYYSAIMSKSPTLAAMQANLENMTLSERSQIQRVTHGMIPFP